MLVGNLISSSSKFLARSSQFTLPQASQPFFTHVETGYSLQFLRARQRPWFYFDSTADGLWVRFSTSHWLNMDDYWLEVREKDQSKKGAASKLKKIKHMSIGGIHWSVSTSANYGSISILEHHLSGRTNITFTAVASITLKYMDLEMI
jgi:hypothetical protein